jgi:hypothetical protein
LFWFFSFCALFFCIFLWLKIPQPMSSPDWLFSQYRKYLKIDNQLNLSVWPNNSERKRWKKNENKNKIRNESALSYSIICGERCCVSCLTCTVAFTDVFADTQPANYWSANADTTTTCLWQDQSQCTTRQESRETGDDGIAVDERSTEFYKRVGVVVE